MITDTPSILILLSGTLWNDSRVLKIADSLSEQYSVTVWCYEGGISRQVPYDVVAFPKKKSLLNTFLERTYFWKPFHRNTIEAHKNIIEADLIWANDLNTLYTGSYLAQLLKAKLVYDSHEIFVETINQFFPSNTKGLKKIFHKYNCKVMQRVGKRVEKKFGDRADHIFTANDSFKEELVKRYNWKCISSLYNMPALSSDFPNTTASIRDGFSETDILVLYHGMFNAGRGLELLIESVVLLPDRFKLIMLGSGFFQKQLEELVRINNLTERVTFLPMVPEDELIDFIKGADIGINLLEKVNLSKWLASPNKLFQYIHAGIPVVCSKSPENIKVFENFDIGFLVDNNTKSIADGIKLIYDKALEFDLFQMEIISKQYSWNSYKVILLNKINSLTS